MARSGVRPNVQHPLRTTPLEILLSPASRLSLHLVAARQHLCAPCRKPSKSRQDYLHLLRHHLHRHLNLAPHFLIFCHHFLHRNTFDNLLRLHLCEDATRLPSRLQRRNGRTCQGGLPSPTFTKRIDSHFGTRVPSHDRQCTPRTACIANEEYIANEGHRAQIMTQGRYETHDTRAESAWQFGG